MKKKLSIALLSTLVAGTACAQSSMMGMDMSNLIQPNYNWSGFYIGGNGGYSTNAHTNYSNFKDGYSYNIGQSFNGGVAGGQIGNNWQFGYAVVGFEMGMDWLNFGSPTNTHTFAGYNSNLESNLNWVITATPRLGFAYDNFLFYGKAGLAVTELRSERSLSQGGTTLSSFNESQYSIGPVFGGGVNYALNNNVIMGVEYNYYTFAPRTFGGYDATNDIAHQYDVGANFSTITGTISYKF